MKFILFPSRYLCKTHEICLNKPGSQSKTGISLLKSVHAAYHESTQSQSGCHATYVLFHRFAVDGKVDVIKTLSNPLYVGKCFDNVDRAKSHIVNAITTDFKKMPKNVKTNRILNCLNSKCDIVILIVPCCDTDIAHMLESCYIDAFRAPGNKSSGRKIYLSKRTRKILFTKALLFFAEKLECNEPDHVFSHKTVRKKRKNRHLCLQCDKRYDI